MKYLIGTFALILLVVVAIGVYAGLVAYPQSVGQVVVGTGGSEGLYNDIAQAYQKELRRYGVDLVLKPDLDGFLTLKSMVVDHSAEAGFVKGGFVGGLQGRLASNDDKTWHDKDVAVLRSVGRLFLEPFWVFSRKGERVATLRELKGRRIFIGTKDSGVRKIATHLLKASGVDAANTTFLEQDLPADGKALTDGQIDAAILVLPPESATLQKLLRNPALHLMNFAVEADAYVNRFPYLSKVVLHQGAVELNPDVPEMDLTLLATQAALVIRSDLNPSVVTLLSHAVLNNPKSGFDKSGDPILFYRAGDFPTVNDSEFEVAPEAKALQTDHQLPFLLRELGPWVTRLGLPFSLTAFASEHGSQFILLLIPLLSILIPSARIAPAVYNWAGRRRLLYWYRRLKQLEGRILKNHTGEQMLAAQHELENIDDAVARIRVPLAFSNQLYDLRLHINLVRERLAPRLIGLNPAPAGE